MTTPLVKPLTREILVGQSAYHVTISTDRITLTPKYSRKSVEWTWVELLASGRDAPSAPLPEPQSKPLPASIATSIARDVHQALTALTKARDALHEAGALPAEVLRTLQGDSSYGAREQRDDWFVEPLLTVAEVASILRVTTRAVRRLPIRCVLIGGEQRFRQSAIREYLRSLETTPVSSGRRY